MLYTVTLTKKKKLFQKPYIINGSTIYITDTKRAKKKFLKSGIRNVIFTKDLTGDEVFGSMLKPLYAYDKSFLMNYLNDMVEHLTHFLKMELPVDSIVVSSSEVVETAIRYAKTVNVIGEGEDEVVGGVSVVYTKKLRRMPDMAIIVNECNLPDLIGVPAVDISNGARSGRFCSTWETMSFKTSLFPFEISAQSLLYLLKTGEDVSFELSSLRKKCPTLFTFC